MLSVIIPLYNKESSISKCLDSIISQSYNDWECIVVDDGSTDNSATIVRHYLNMSSQVQYYYQSNQGPSSARNAGVFFSHYEWVVFIDADDYFLPEAFSTFIELIKSNPHCNVFSCNFYRKINQKLYKYSNFYCRGYIKNPYKQWALKRFMPRAGATVIRKNLMEMFPFNTTLRRFEDVESLFEMMRTEYFFCSKKCVMVYELDSISASKPRNDIKEDFLGFLAPEGKSDWEKVILFDLYRLAIINYPQLAPILYKNTSFLSFLVCLKWYAKTIICYCLSFLDRFMNKF